MTLLSVTTNCNIKITPSNVIFGNVEDMQNVDWKDLSEQWERVRWARLRWQMATLGADNMTAAANSVGIKPGTYRAYERNPNDGNSKSNNLPFDVAKELGKKFGVHWVWLLSGEGSPFDTAPTGPILRVNNALKELPQERQEKIADLLVSLIDRDGTMG